MCVFKMSDVQNKSNFFKFKDLIIMSNLKTHCFLLLYLIYNYIYDLFEIKSTSF